MEQRLQNVLIPKDSVEFSVELNLSWRRDYGSYNTVFGIEYQTRKVVLLFKAQPREDGTIVGEFWAGTIGTTAETNMELKKISEDFDFEGGEHTFEIGHDDDEVFIIEKKSPIALRQSFEAYNVGYPVSFITPDFKWRPSWDVKVKLL